MRSILLLLLDRVMSLLGLLGLLRLLRIGIVQKVSLPIRCILCRVRVHVILPLVDGLRECGGSCGVDTIVGRIVVPVIEAEVQMQAIVIGIHSDCSCRLEASSTDESNAGGGVDLKSSEGGRLGEICGRPSGVAQGETAALSV